ncbi:hypothetical protein I546_3694 [Mycobacterium kansasii 732]|nr:hypothetical protein I546_3694 [Mycobacterium kansasii 732]
MVRPRSAAREEFPGHLPCIDKVAWVAAAVVGYATVVMLW